MPKIDLESIEQRSRTGYPPPFDQAVAGRLVRRLAPATGLSDFGVSHVVLKPGAWSSQRHWHDGEDEFVVITAGEAVLVEDSGSVVLRAGHHLRNDSDSDCAFVVFGGGACTGGGYSDIDMRFTAEGEYVHKDGTPYEKSRI